MSIDLKSMSLSELKILRDRVAKAIARFEKQRIKEARSAIEKVAREFGYSVDDVLGDGPKKRTPAKAAAKGRKKTKSKPKYRNPANPAQTWTGRGRRPEWFKDAIASGKSEKDLLI